MTERRVWAAETMRFCCCWRGLGSGQSRWFDSELDDLDFENGWITVRGKNDRYTQLPRPVEVGEAIADYLRNARPKSTSRCIFLKTKAPITSLYDSSAIGGVVRQAIFRAVLMRL